MKIRRLFYQDSNGGVPKLFYGRRVSWSFNTRVAIRAACDLLNLKPGDEILAPAYNCGSELDPLIHAGINVKLYPVGRDLRISATQISNLVSSRTRAVYVTHYFGIIQPNLSDLRLLCDANGLRLIEDCALSLLSGQHPIDGSTGDVSLFCLYKFFPTLQGGALVINASDLSDDNPFRRSAPRVDVAKSLVRSTMSNLAKKVRGRRLESKKYGNREGYAKASSMSTPHKLNLPDMPAHYYFADYLKNRKISNLSYRTIRSFDVRDAIAVRRRNWAFYKNIFENVAEVEMISENLSDYDVPLNMPVLVKDRDRIASQLQAEGVGATAWWSGFNKNLDWSGQADAFYLKENVLSLPLHQYLGEEHIRHIVKKLRDCF